MSEPLVLAGQEFFSRLIIGTGKFASADALRKAAQASGAQMATLAIKRVDTRFGRDDIVQPLKDLGITFMPNT